MDLQTRICKVCRKNKFRVLHKSKQQFCGVLCALKTMNKQQALIVERSFWSKWTVAG